jgi:hypothetical protein
MGHRRTAAASALSGLLLAVSGCAGDGDTGSDTATDTAGGTATDTASDAATDGAGEPSEVVTTHAEAYGAVVSHPAYLNVQLSEPETVPALVQEVTDGRLKASSDGNVWTFADASGDCATSVSPDETGAGDPSTTCGGENVDEAFGVALAEVLSGRDDAAAVAARLSEQVSARAGTDGTTLAEMVESGFLDEAVEGEDATLTTLAKKQGRVVSFAVEVDGFCLQGELDEVAVGTVDATWEDAHQVTKGTSVKGECRAA